MAIGCQQWRNLGVTRAGTTFLPDPNTLVIRVPLRQRESLLDTYPDSFGAPPRTEAHHKVEADLDRRKIRGSPDAVSPEQVHCDETVWRCSLLGHRRLSCPGTTLPRSKRMPIPAINSVFLRETINAYTREYTVFSSTVEPLPGALVIKEKDECVIRLTATNDPYFGVTGGMQLLNVRWHVESVGTAISIVVPDLPLEAREGPSSNLPLLTAGDHVPELYIFPRFGKRKLEQGETDQIEIRGFAENLGVIIVMFDLVADVDPDAFVLTDQPTIVLANQPAIQVT